MSLESKYSSKASEIVNSKMPCHHHIWNLTPKGLRCSIANFHSWRAIAAHHPPRNTTRWDKSCSLFYFIANILKLHRLRRKSCELVSLLWGFRIFSSHSQAWFMMMSAEIVLPPQKINMYTKPEEQVRYTVQLPTGCTYNHRQ